MVFRQHLFKERIPILNRGLDAYAMRQRIISKNIANATSEHYRPERVRFEEFYRQAEVVAKGNKTDDKHISLGRKDESEIQGEFDSAPVPRPEVYFSGDAHVNVDKEMSELAQNQIRFRFASRAMKSYFRELQTAIIGRAR